MSERDDGLVERNVGVVEDFLESGRGLATLMRGEIGEAVLVHHRRGAKLVWRRGLKCGDGLGRAVSIEEDGGREPALRQAG